MRITVPVSLGKLLLLLAVLLLALEGFFAIFLGVDLGNFMWFGMVGLVIPAFMLFFVGLLVEDRPLGKGVLGTGRKGKDTIMTKRGILGGLRVAKQGSEEDAAKGT